MNSLAEILMEYHDEITKYLYIGYARWDDMINRIERQERTSSHDFADEQIWTFLVGCGYAIAREQGVAMLTRTLTGSNQREPTNPKIWFEVLPIPPREGEGETHLDLALGIIAGRKGTESGIELDDVESSWICFCEMKWYSDISISVTYDIHRNQLARVIENALCFQRSGKYAEKVYVTLVTPSIFRNASLKSRLYQYKFEEYNTNQTCLIDDLNACVLEENDQPDWSFPSDLTQRVMSLSLRWATYDELFENLPDSAIVTRLDNFWRQHGNYQGRAFIA
ncbi:MAG: hypothetical protein AAGB97_09135 [Dehalococcoidia bacterium]|nr:hypothetical protein [Chloroflexota bacterium]MBT9161016.1 hypothetical protein [Chloroflexota bacterium]